eukprot:4389201-Karenia_brevis.AAC.1
MCRTVGALLRFSSRAIQAYWDRPCVPYFPGSEKVGKDHGESLRRAAKAWKPKVSSIEPTNMADAATELGHSGC